MPASFRNTGDPVVGFPARFSGIFVGWDRRFCGEEWIWLSAAGARQDQLVGRWELEARLEPEQGRNAGDDGTADRHCVPSRRGEAVCVRGRTRLRSEEHTSELQSRNDISYAVFCLKKKKKQKEKNNTQPNLKEKKKR